MAQEMNRNPCFPYLCLSPPKYHKLQISGDDDYSVFSSKAGSITPSWASVEETDQEFSSMAAEERLYLTGLTIQSQNFASRYELCLSHLREAACEADALRLENAHLRIANADLTRRLRHLVGNPMAKDGRQSALEEEFRRIRLAISPPEAASSPRSVLEARSRVSLPKRISVRSTGYQKLSPDQGSNMNGGWIRVSGTGVVGSQQQRVLDGSGKKKEDEELDEEEGSSAVVEVEVYDQGMFKTELCNKWQESGGAGCIYGDSCQFAHGISELRPVIRHPRYKTQICRMALAGDTCPYGHRCHFRHAQRRTPPL